MLDSLACLHWGALGVLDVPLGVDLTGLWTEKEFVENTKDNQQGISARQNTMEIATKYAKKKVFKFTLSNYLSLDLE